MILLPYLLLCGLATDHGTSSEMHRGFGSINSRVLQSGIRAISTVGRDLVRMAVSLKLQNLFL